jgi:hypothetical protein
MDQEPVTVETSSDVVLNRRQSLLALSLDAKIAAEGGAPSLGTMSPGSSAVLENTARREGAALDALYVEHFVPNFTAFTQSEIAKRFFVAAEPAYRTATGGFANAQAAALKPIQDTCRAEQNLAPYKRRTATRRDLPERE